MLTQKAQDKPALAGLSNNDLISRILEALWATDICLEERPCAPDSEDTGKVVQLTLYIRAIGWHWSGNLWVATATEAGHNTCGDQ